jgi:hypothetical protein
MEEVNTLLLSPETEEIRNKDVLSSYNYFIISEEVIKDQIEVEKNMKLILVVLKAQDKIIAKKTISFDIKKLKILNIEVDGNSIIIKS